MGLVFVVINIPTDIVSLWDNRITKFRYPVGVIYPKKKKELNLSLQPYWEVGDRDDKRVNRTTMDLYIIFILMDKEFGIKN